MGGGRRVANLLLLLLIVWAVHHRLLHIAGLRVGIPLILLLLMTEDVWIPL